MAALVTPQPLTDEDSERQQSEDFHNEMTAMAYDGPPTGMTPPSSRSSSRNGEHDEATRGAATPDHAPLARSETQAEAEETAAEDPVESERQCFMELVDLMQEYTKTAMYCRNQCDLLAQRCRVIVGVMTMMKREDSTARPSQPLLTVFRSIFAVIDMHRNLDWLPVRFTSVHIFREVTLKLKAAWHMYDAKKWAIADREAEQLDEVEARELMAMNKLDDMSIDDTITAIKLATWRCSAEQVNFDDSEAVVRATHHTVVDGVYCKRLRACCWELLPQFISPATTEAFILDIAKRVTWCHPNVVRVIGGFAERIGEDGNAYDALGYFYESIPRSTTFLGAATLHDLLFVIGYRLPIRLVMKWALDIADAVQYIMFSEGEVDPGSLSWWETLQPSSMLIDGTTHRLVLNPLVFIECGYTSRWKPPVDALCPHSYAICNVLIAMLTNTHPFNHLTSREDLASVAGRLGTQSYDVPRYISPVLQHLCSAAFLCKSTLLDDPSLCDVYTDEDRSMDLPAFRRRLFDVQALLLASAPPELPPNPNLTPAPIEPDMDDFGVALTLEAFLSQGAPAPEDAASRVTTPREAEEGIEHTGAPMLKPKESPQRRLDADGGAVDAYQEVEVESEGDVEMEERRAES